MRELGASSEQCHREIGRAVAKEYRPDRLICVGRAALAIAADAQLHGFPADFVEHFPDAQAATVVAQRVREGDLVLLKGSRAIGLEAIGRAIMARRAVKVA
jgi:UDP-N-acetylmuramoyl-tripeptide--D-alanyl-D-alanine ligase